MPTFTETQKVPDQWISVALCVVTPVFFYWLVKDLHSLKLSHYLYMLGVHSVVVGFLMLSAFRKIIYQIDGQGIRYCVKPLGKWQTILWADIDRAYVREFALIGEYPKYQFDGTRQGPNGWAYVIFGNYGLQINKKSGGKILLGTQRPDDLRAFLDTFPVAATTDTL